MSWFNLKEFFIWFVIFTVNYLKCSIVNFQKKNFFAILLENIQIKEAQLNWLFMKTLTRILASSTVKNLRILRRAWILNEAFLHSFSMCFLNFSWLSMAIPRSSISLELLIFFPLIFKAKGVFCFSSRIINWNLLGFIFSELAWNQLSTFSRSYLRFEKIASNLLSKLCNVLSSAKLQTSDFITLRKRSLSWIFRITTISNFAVFYPWNLLFS